MKKQEEEEKITTTDSKKIAWYILIEKDLYRRGFSTPLLKCLLGSEVKYILEELHNGICSLHSGKRTLKV